MRGGRDGSGRCPYVGPCVESVGQGLVEDVEHHSKCFVAMPSSDHRLEVLDRLVAKRQKTLGVSESAAASVSRWLPFQAMV